MIVDGLPTRLRWTGGRGLATLNGEDLRLAECPQIFPGVVLDALDYAPGVVAMYMPRFEGWKDMDGEQRAACDRFLRQQFGLERRS
jgi:hypothetical protein